MGEMMRYLLLLILSVGGLVACSGRTNPVAEKTAEQGFVPPAGQTLFIVGQDNDTIAAYQQAVELPAPAGVTSYTSLAQLEGIDEAAYYGAGRIYLDELAAQNPESTIALGLYLVDYLDSINSGAADGQIDQLLAQLAAYERPVYLRFGYEFDGMWNHYDPESYKAAWRYFRQRMIENGVSNVAMVWQSAAYCDGTYQGYPLEAWYPGDDQVDWIGSSFFTQLHCDLEPVEEVVAFARAHNKPLMIAEAAPQQYEIGRLSYSTLGREFADRSADEIWAAWYAPFFTLINENADVIRAVAYINAHWDEQPMWGPPYANGYWGDSRVQANPLIQERWQAELKQPQWRHASPTLFEEVGYRP